MKLSEINAMPSYPVTIPSTGKKTTFRPITVKEEKALLIAQESGDPMTMAQTMEQVARNCVAKCPDRLATYDVEFLMTHIRAKSVGETSNLLFFCPSCKSDDAVAKVPVDLTKVYVNTGKRDTKLKISDKITLIMRPITVNDLVADSEEELERATVRGCIQTVYYEDDVYHLDEEPKEEIDAFIETLLPSQMDMIVEYVRSLPVACIDVNYTCPKCGQNHQSTLKGIKDFF